MRTTTTRRRGSRLGRAGAAMALIAAIVGGSVAGAASPAGAAVSAPVAVAPAAAPAGNWAWYGYRLNRTETSQIANLSLWSAFSGVKGTRLIPYSDKIMSAYAFGWILTARNARSMGQCLAISYVGTGLIVGC